METRKQYLTVDQIAETLSLGTRTVMNMIRRGELPAYRFRSEYRVRPDDLSIFLESSKVQEPTLSGEASNGQESARQRTIWR